MNRRLPLLSLSAAATLLAMPATVAAQALALSAMTALVSYQARGYALIAF